MKLANFPIVGSIQVFFFLKTGDELRPKTQGQNSSFYRCLKNAIRPLRMLDKMQLTVLRRFDYFVTDQPVTAGF